MYQKGVVDPLGHAILLKLEVVSEKLADIRLSTLLNDSLSESSQQVDQVVDIV